MQPALYWTFLSLGAGPGVSHGGENGPGAAQGLQGETASGLIKANGANDLTWITGS
jgi:hypothetical protein